MVVLNTEKPGGHDLAGGVNVPASGLSIAGTTVTATAAEINNACDVSSVSQSITEAGAIDLDAKHVDITGPESSTYAVTLAAPTAAQYGLVKVIHMSSTTSTNAVTLALTNVIGGSAASSASFNAADEALVVVGSEGGWLVLAENGVTLS